MDEPIELNIPEDDIEVSPTQLQNETGSKALKAVVGPVDLVQEQQPQVSQFDLRKFYRMRAKQPSLYSYDGRGNLVERDSNGSVKTTIPLPRYRPLNPTEIAELEESRREAISEAEDKYNTAMEELSQAIKDFNAGRVLPNAVKDAQLAVQEADIIRTHAMYAEYFVRVLSGLDFKDIYEDARIKKKLDFNVFQAQVCDHRLRRLWSKEMTSLEEEEEAEMEADMAVEEEPASTQVGGQVGRQITAKGPDSNVVIIFNRPDDNEYGYLANDWPIEFNWKGIKYFTVDQALAAEKARFYGKPQDIKEIMKTRSTTTMRSIARKLGEAPGQYGSLIHTGSATDVTPAIETPNERISREQRNAAWEKERYNILVSLLLAKFRQNSQIGKLLIETGDAILARADHRDIEDGIGIAITDPRAGHQSKWRGKNILGKALMDSRFKLRTENNDAIVDELTDVVKKKTISAEDAEIASKAKTATIINKRRSAVPAAAAQSFQKLL